MFPAHPHGDVFVPNEDNPEEMVRHIMWNPEIHPTFAQLVELE